MIEILNSSGLTMVLVVLPLTIIANSLFGAALAYVEDSMKFSMAKLKSGLTKGILVYLGILIYSIITYLMPELTLEIFGGAFTLVDAVYVVVFAAVVRYGIDGLMKLAKIMGYPVDGVDTEG